MPSRAEYWHIGDMTMRFGKVVPRSSSGVNSSDAVIASNARPDATFAVLADSTRFGKNPPMMPKTSLQPPALVVAVVYDGMNLFELGIVAEVFASDRPDFARALYRLRFAQAEAGELAAAGGIRIRTDGG